VESILKTEGLWKLYRAGKLEVPALRGVNFQVAPGESVAVMGPSGCGKSSLLYVIGGLAQASRGHVLVDGNDLTTMSDAARTKLRRHKIGFVFQRFNLLPTLTAKGNIAIAQFIHGDGFDPHRFDVVTKMLGLEGRTTNRPRCRAASSSVWPSRAPSSTNQKSCSRTSLQVISTRKIPTSSWKCCASSTKIWVKRS
jgi:putative ABC transport system ATP-binding protein